MVRPVALVVSLLCASAAWAETPEQRQACTDDAFQYCSEAIPDRGRVFSCLIEWRAQISQLCRAGLAPYLPAEPPPAAATSPAKAAKAAKPVKPMAKPVKPATAGKPAAKPVKTAKTAKPAAKPARPVAKKPAGKRATKTAAKQTPGAPLKLSPTGR